MLSDIRLPDIGGFDLLREVRSNAPVQPTKFVFLTGHCDLAIEERALAVGADALFRKPSDWHGWREIAAAIKRLIQQGLEAC